MLVLCNGGLVDVAVVFLSTGEFTQHVHNALKFCLPFFGFLTDSIQGIQFAETIIPRNPTIGEVLKVETIENAEDGVVHVSDDRYNAHVLSTEPWFKAT